MLFSSLHSNTTRRIQYTAGLVRKQYTNGYFADNLSWFDGKTPANVTAQTTTLSQSIGETDSVMWQGYFRPTTTETYTFYTNSDDSSWVWVGQAAFAPSTSNEVVDNSGLHGATETSGTIALTAGIYYPILIYLGNNTGPCVFNFYHSTATISKTQTITGKVFYNPFSEGF